MRYGEVVESGDTETIFADPQHEYTRALLAAVPGQGWQPNEVQNSANTG
jgi:ABC-type dipeptide/oligopeptide/nickel transport system ATPase component